MAGHVCPWWGGYFIDHRWRRLFHRPERIVAPYVRPGMTALDFGCGMGFFAIPLARLVGEGGCVIAADLQPQMLDVLVRRAKQAGVAERIHPHRCQADSTGLEQRVDFALAFWSVHEVPDARSLLRDIQGCLVEGGRLLVVEPVIHVPATAFARTITVASELGLRLEEEPRVTLSRAAVLAKPFRESQNKGEPGQKGSPQKKGYQ